MRSRIEAGFIQVLLGAGCGPLVTFETAQDISRAPRRTTRPRSSCGPSVCRRPHPGQRSQFLSDQGYAARKSAIEGYENMLLRRYQTYIHAMTQAPVKPDVINILTQSNFTAAATPFPSAILNVKYAAVPQKDGTYPLSVNPDPPGPAFFPGGVEVLPEERILERMREPGWDPRRTALLEAAAAGLPERGEAGPAGTVRLVHDSPNRITASVQAEGPVF